jgi:hypothetical protein
VLVLAPFDAAPEQQRLDKDKTKTLGGPTGKE